MKKMLLSLMACLLAACQSGPTITKEQAFPQMYVEKPLSIVVAPIINKSTAADAGDLYQTTIAKPIAEAGYYVAPIPFTRRLLAQEGFVDGLQLNDIKVSSFRDVFGVDAVLLITINEWDTNYYVIGGHVKVSLDMSLVSTHTNQTMWRYAGQIKVDTTSRTGLGLIGNMIATAINTARMKYVDAADKVNKLVVHTLPLGARHEGHLQDKKVSMTLYVPPPETELETDPETDE